MCHLLSWPQPPEQTCKKPAQLSKLKHRLCPLWAHPRNCHSARAAVCCSSMMITAPLHTEPLPPSPQSSATTSPGCRLWLLSAKMRQLSAAHSEQRRLLQRPLQRRQLGPAKLCSMLRPKRRSITHHVSHQIRKANDVSKATRQQWSHVTSVVTAQDTHPKFNRQRQKNCLL